MANARESADAPYDFVLPPERIAQRPVKPYHAAKLLVHTTGEIREAAFIDLGEFLRAGDLLIFNDSRVIPARLFGRLDTGGAVEVLLLTEVGANEWRCLGKPLKKLKTGTVIRFSGDLYGTVTGRPEEQRIDLRFALQSGDGDIAAIREAVRSAGVMPVPPYIRGGRGDDADKTDYQTIFSKVEGSVAAPTASLHFTPELLQRLEARGCSFEYVTLHVGAPSFTAAWSDEAGSPELIPPGTELYRFSRGALAAIAACRARGGRVVGVGTTVVRALESMARNEGAADGEWHPTSLFIRPGFDFKAIDLMVTNFHQPRSTHLLLVEAFIGNGALQTIYTHALRADYRFFSYGDGMLLGRS